MFNAVAFNQRTINGLRIVSIAFTRDEIPVPEPTNIFARPAEPAGVAFSKPLEPAAVAFSKPAEPTSDWETEEQAALWEYGDNPPLDGSAAYGGHLAHAGWDGEDEPTTNWH